MSQTISARSDGVAINRRDGVMIVTMSRCGAALDLELLQGVRRMRSQIESALPAP